MAGSCNDAWCTATFVEGYRANAVCLFHASTFVVAFQTGLALHGNQHSFAANVIRWERRELGAVFNGVRILGQAVVEALG